MALSWNEIKERAAHFSAEWADAFNEDAEAKTFLFEFFNVFGISQRKVSNFEHRVKKLDDHDGYIDLFWPQTILVEMKSRGKSLDKAYLQAREYLKAVRQEELPKYILVSDFEHFRLYDLEEDALMEFKLAELVHRTNVDGSDLAAKLQELFQVLNTPVEKRYRNLDEQLSAFLFVYSRFFC